MKRGPGTSISKAERRYSLRILTYNAALWSAGNAVAAAPLLLYFASQRMYTISFREIVLFAAAMIAMVRLFAPRIIRRAGGVKRIAISTLALAGVVLLLMPFVPRDSGLSDDFALLVDGGLFSLCLLLEAMGGVAIWTWIGEFAPSRVRGRYLGCRESLRLVALAPAVLAAGYIAASWRTDQRPAAEKLTDYSTLIAVGGLLLLAAAMTLVAARDIGRTEKGAGERIWREWFRPVKDPQFFRLLFFGVWMSFCVGLSLPAQGYFPRYVLELSPLTPYMFLAGATLGQALISRSLGRSCDIVGSRTVVLISQLIAAFVPFFFLVASPEQPWWIAAAALVLVAQVGVNLGLSNLMLKLAPPHERSGYVAVFLAFTAAAFAFGRLIGDLLLEALAFHRFQIAGRELDDYDYLFYIGWITSLLGSVFLLGLKEPGARGWIAVFQKPSTTPFPSAGSASTQPIRHPLD